MRSSLASSSGLSPGSCMNSKRTREPTAGSRTVGRRGSQKKVMVSTSWLSMSASMTSQRSA